MNGLSIYICIGKWARPRIFIDGPALRIILGWLAIGIMATDIERFLGEVNLALAQALDRVGNVREKA